MRHHNKTYLVLIICALASSSLAQDDAIDKHFATYEPVFLAEMWRHGARAAAKNTFEQAYVDLIGAGNLQPNGMRMHYVLGRQIGFTWRNNIFKSPIKQSEYEIHSSEFQRTELSAAAHAFGLFNEGTGLKVENLSIDAKIALPSYKDLKVDVTSLGDNALPFGLNTTPIRVHLKNSDTLFFKGLETTCPFAEATLQAASKAAFAANSKDLDRFIPTITASSVNGFLKNMPSPNTVWDTKSIGILSDLFKCSEFYDNKLLAGLESMKDWMKYIFGVYYYYDNYPDAKVTKLGLTGSSKLILEKMELQIKGDKNKQRYLGLSAHEANVFPYMMGYNLLSIDCLKKNA
jgi:Histidine phosphatase superfamily (branch 2)